MGSEQRCWIETGGRRVEGRALLETDELLFRGEPRLKIPLRSIKGLKVEGHALVVRSPQGVVRFELGEKTAVRWAKRIQEPPSLLDKLGVKKDAVAVLVGDFEAPFVAELRKQAKRVVPGKVAADATHVLVAVGAKAKLGAVRTLRAKLPRGAALWIVYPKGVAAVTEADVIAAGRAAGLKDVKVARFSATHTALKFV